MPRRVLEQHIAVFGESGSGKSVLLSSFYGFMREKQTQERSGLDVVADDAGQGGLLLQNYLGMTRENRLPPANKFSAVPYSFTAWLQHRPVVKKGAKQTTAADGIRLVWHDYPGEWFEQSTSGAVEESRRAETFRSLLASDVAIILVDGERLAANAGQEERYLKLLFTNIRNGLLPVISELEDDGRPLVRFPRIWMFALSKADLLPEVDVEELRDLVVLNAAHEVDQLRALLKRAVVDPDAMTVGEDFVLLSSLRFAEGRISTSERVGVDLIMPIASILPLERFVRWADARSRRGKVAETLLGQASAVAGAAGLLVGFVSKLAKRSGPFAAVATAVSAAASKEVIDRLVGLAGDSLRSANAEALARGEYLKAALLRFGLDLETGERQGVLERSRR